MADYTPGIREVGELVAQPTDVAYEKIAELPAEKLIALVRDRVPPYLLSLLPIQQRMRAVLDNQDHGLTGALLARALLISRRHAEALSVLDEIPSDGELPGDSEVIRGLCFETMKDINAALAQFKLAADEHQNHEGAAYYAAVLEKKHVTILQFAPFVDAKVLTSMDPSIIREISAYALRGKPDPVAHITLAGLHMVGGSYQEAMREAEAALAQGDPMAYLLTGQFKQLGGKWREALELYSKACLARNVGAEALFQEALKMHCPPQERWRYVEPLLFIGSTSEPLAFEHGLALYDSKDNEALLKVAEQALATQHGPVYCEVMRILAMRWMFNIFPGFNTLWERRKEITRPQCQNLIQETGRQVEDYRQRMQHAEMDEADLLSITEDGLQIQEAHAYAHYGLGMHQIQNPGICIPHFAKAKNAGFPFEDSWYELGSATLATGEIETATELLLTAITQRDFRAVDVLYAVFNSLMSSSQYETVGGMSSILQREGFDFDELRLTPGNRQKIGGPIRR